MTASKTPNLGLMNPQGSDSFSTTDFSQTFGILDTNPGITTVANQAALPTGFSNNQHGRRVWQADQDVEWVWNQPSSTVAGAWKRVGCKGWLGGVSNSGAVTAASSAGIKVLEVSLLVPGGRPVLVMYSFLWVQDNQTGQAGINYHENGNYIDTKYYSGRAYGTSSVPPASGSNYYLRNIAPTTQQNITFNLTLVNNNSLGSGTATIWNTTLDIIEV